MLGGGGDVNIDYFIYMSILCQYVHGDRYL